MGARPGSRRGARPAYSGAMLRKLVWMAAILVVVSAVSTLVDRRQAARRRELWAEATDPN